MVLVELHLLDHGADIWRNNLSSYQIRYSLYYRAIRSTHVALEEIDPVCWINTERRVQCRIQQ